MPINCNVTIKTIETVKSRIQPEEFTETLNLIAYMPAWLSDIFYRYQQESNGIDSLNPIEQAHYLMNEFDPYIIRWNLIPDGEPLTTQSSKLLPVYFENKPAMLKIAMVSEERAGGQLMIWWDGRGAARILAHDGDAFVMERATGERSLLRMAKQNQDDEASRIICAVVAELHAQVHQPLPLTLVPLSDRFKALHSGASQQSSVLKQAAVTARELLMKPQECVVLHGDIHHQNILDFADRGWLAIDPKGLIGERGFDYANIFCNPDWDVATKPGRLEQQASIVAEAAGLDRIRLLKWILAYAGLSAAWHLEDGSDPTLAIEVAKMAVSALGL